MAQNWKIFEFENKPHTVPNSMMKLSERMLIMVEENKNTIKNLLPIQQFTPALDKDIDNLLSKFLTLYDWEKIKHAEVSIVHVNLDSNYILEGMTDKDFKEKNIKNENLEQYSLSEEDVLTVLNKYELIRQLDKLNISYFGVLEKSAYVCELFVLFICLPRRQTYEEYDKIMQQINKNQYFDELRYESEYAERFVYKHSNSLTSVDNSGLASNIKKYFYEIMNNFSIYGDRANDKRLIMCHLNKQHKFRKLVSEQLEGPIETEPCIDNMPQTES